MTISINSCLKPCSSPSLPSIPPRTKTSATLLPCSMNKEANWWRSGCVSTTLACVVIASTVGFAGGDGFAVEAAPEGKAMMATMRWSDKRQCPPWRQNSLETIVPENLPRALSRQRPDGRVSYETTAPKLKAFFIVPNSSGNGCFSL